MDSEQPAIRINSKSNDGPLPSREVVSDVARITGTVPEIPITLEMLVAERRKKERSGNPIQVITECIQEVQESIRDYMKHKFNPLYQDEVNILQAYLRSLEGNHAEHYIPSIHLIGRHTELLDLVLSQIGLPKEAEIRAQASRSQTATARTIHREYVPFQCVIPGFQAQLVEKDTILSPHVNKIRTDSYTLRFRPILSERKTK